MSTIRKAIAAGVAAALATALSSLATEIPRTSAGWGAVGGAALTAGVVTAYGVWRTPNASSTPGVTTRSGPAPY